MAQQPSRRVSFEPVFTLGNVVTLITVIAASILVVVKLEADFTNHALDSQIHPTVAEREALIDQRIDLRLRPLAVQIEALSQQIDLAGKLDRLLYRFEERQDAENRRR